MSVFSIIARFAARRLKRQQSLVERLQAAPLAPRPLERRRVLDASAAAALLTPLGELSDTVQAADYSTDNQGSENEEGLVQQGIAENTPPANLVIAPFAPIMENGVAQLELTFDDPDEEDFHTIEVDWGDGSTPESFEVFENSLSASHRYFDDNPTGTSVDMYEVTVTVMDSYEESVTESALVEVSNVAPEITFINIVSTPIDEGSFASLQLSFDDPGLLDTFTVDIDWGDGSAIETINLGVGETALLTTHQYLDDDPTGDPSNIYNVNVTVTDDDSGSDMATDTVTVNNVPPVLVLNPIATINENGAATLSGNVSDVGSLDTFTLEINWGDSLSPNNMQSFSLGTTLLTEAADGINWDPATGNFSLDHLYLDDNPTGDPSNVYNVNVTVTDDDTGSDMATETVTVNNVAPQITFLSVSSPIDENGFASLQLSFDDPGLLDTFTVDIDWGDGSAIETINLGVGETALLTTHQYLDDDPTGDPSNIYNVNVTVTDDDSGSDMATDTVTVNNVPPVLVLNPIATINENGAATLSGNVSDVGSLDTFTLEINWGDSLSPNNMQSFSLGTTLLTEAADGINWDPATGNFSLDHLYLDDNPTGDPSNVYNVNVTVTDDDTGSDMATETVTVNNVAPQITFLSVSSPIDENGFASLQLSFDDPGLLDTFTVDIDWGDGSAIETINLGVGETALLTTHQYLDDDPTGDPSNIYNVNVTVTDDDSGSDMATDTVTVNNVPPVLVLNPIATINENGAATLSGNVSDVGSLDTFTLEINWGDSLSPNNMQSFSLGTTLLTEAADGINWDPATGNFSLDHLYLDDNPTGDPSNIYNVNVTVTDDDTGSDMATETVTVNNVAPQITIDGAPLSSPEGTQIDLTSTLVDPGTLDTHVYDWVVTFNGNVIATGSNPDFSFTPADNGTHTVTLTVTDDDTGVGVDAVSIEVTNVAPTLTGGEVAKSLNEGQVFTLGELGLGLSDPGFSLPAAFTVETFMADMGTSIDWGDGSPQDTLLIPTTTNGGPGVPTTATFDSAPHAYADNGTYTVTLTFSDDDGGETTAQFEVIVDNVAPTLTLTNRLLVIDEGDVLSLPDLGTFTDPGFNNPLNPNGASVESFTYEITWEPIVPTETNLLPATVVDGAQGTDTSGTLADSHLYIDNDEDSIFEITVTLFDDDGGSDTQVILVQVNNTNPILDPIAATDINNQGETFLTLTFEDIGIETAYLTEDDAAFRIMIDWGYVGVEGLEGFSETVDFNGATPETFVIQHTYEQQPNPANPAADLTLRVQILDDDNGSVIIVEDGASNIEITTITNPGIGGQPVAIDTTPQVPRLTFERTSETVLLFQISTSTDGSTSGSEIRVASSDAKATTELALELRVIDSYGVESEGIPLKAEVLNNLPKLFAKLPDNHYAIYLVRQENNSQRLVIEVYLRNGRIIDPGDDTEGLRNRPPTDKKLQIEQPPEPEQDPEAAAILNGLQEKLDAEMTPGDEIRIEPLEQGTRFETPEKRLLPVAAGLVATRSFGTWAHKVDRALAKANKQKWRQLRRRTRDKRKNR